MKLFNITRKSAAQKAYEAKLKQAQDAQRAGKISVFADLMVEAEALAEKLPQP